MSLSISFLLFSFPKLFIREFRQKEMKRQKKNAQGAVLMAGASRIWKFVKSNLLGEHDVDLLEPAFDFLRFFSTSFEPRAVDRSVFCHLSPRPAPPPPQSLSHNRRHHPPSRRPARGCVSYFLFFVSCVMSTFPSIALSVHFFASTAAAGFVCYTAARLLAATSQPNVYW